MARKKGRLTLKKKSIRKAERKTPGGVSQQQFAAFTQDYGSFISEDENHEELTFSIGDVAYIQYQDPENTSGNTGDVAPTDYWIGEIKEIKSNNIHEVWVRVQWYWSPQEVADVIKSFKPSICGKYEKLASDNYDIISVYSFIRHVEVKNFDEISICQAAIGDKEWFSRYEFLYDSKRISPKVTHNACTICKVPYIPGQVKIHHFCPRPSCRNFYHQSCLVKNGYVAETRPYRLLETWPDIDRTATVEELCRTTKRLKKDNCARGSGVYEKDPLSDIPTLLIAVAKQPILRGTEEGGIVGNITSVAAARNLIYKAFSGNGLVPGDWKARINLSAAQAFPEADSLPNCFCPSCYSPI